MAAFAGMASRASASGSKNGGEVVLNVNDFTLFQFKLDGDTMRGNWERLHGDEAGHKYPSSLQRVRE